MKVAIFTILIFFSINSFCQGEVLFLTGKTLKYDSLNVDHENKKINGVFYSGKKEKAKPKKYDLEYDLVYAIKQSNSNQIDILYKPDSTQTHEYGIEDMGYYLEGQLEANKNFKTPLITAVGFGTGVAVGYVLYSSVPIIAMPLVYSAAVLIPKTRIRKKKIEDKTNIEQKAYKEGYKKAAKSKKFKNAIISNASGLVIGIIVGFSTAK
jgi:hypothetical protein